MARRGSSTALKAYRAKRNFSSTPEPTGKTTSRSPRRKDAFFCVQKHLASHLHYDFRLEHRGVLLSWAVPKGPSLNPKDKRLAMRVEDHPFDYGEFEGVIPEGYGAGIVMLWDKGTWKSESDDIDAALEKGELKFMLDGIKLKGSWVLVRTGGGRPDSNGESRTWLLIKHRDEWAGPIDIATKAPLSVKCFCDFPDILAKDKPDVWQSHLPAKGGEAGTMLQKIIDKAARIKLAMSRPAERKSQSRRPKGVKSSTAPASRSTKKRHRSRSTSR